MISPEILAHNLEQTQIELLDIAERNRGSDLYISASLTAGFVGSAVISITGRSVKEQVERVGYTYSGRAEVAFRAVQSRFN